MASDQLSQVKLFIEIMVANAVSKPVLIIGFV